MSTRTSRTFAAAAFVALSATAPQQAQATQRPSDQTGLRSTGLDDCDPDLQAFPVALEAAGLPLEGTDAFTRSVEQLTSKIESIVAEFIRTRGMKEGTQFVDEFDECGNSPQLGLNALLKRQTHSTALSKLLADKSFCATDGSLSLAGTSAMIAAHYRMTIGNGPIAQAIEERRGTPWKQLR